MLESYSELFTSGGVADGEQYGSHQPTESYDDERSQEYQDRPAIGEEMQEADSGSEQAEQQSESGESEQAPSEEQELASEQGSREDNASEDPESRSSQENEGGDAESDDEDDEEDEAENGNNEATNSYADNDVELAEPVVAAAAAATSVTAAEPMEADEADEAEEDEEEEEDQSNDNNEQERDEDEEMVDKSESQPETAAAIAPDTKSDAKVSEEQHSIEANGEDDAEAKQPATGDDEAKDDVSVSASDTKSESRKRRRSRSKSRSKSPPAKRAARRTSPARNTDDFTNDEDEPEFDENAILLSWYDSDLHLSINKPDLCSARPISDGALGLAWAGARATHGVNSGKVCYEVQVNEINRVQNLSDERNLYELRCGWSTLSDSLQLGESPLSYGYSGCAKKAADNVFSEYGIKYGSRGDVVGVYLDLESTPCTIQYTVNGEAQGVAFEFEKADLDGKALFPHVISKNLAFTVNFGQSPKLLVNEERPNRTRRDDSRRNNQRRSDKDSPKDSAEKPKAKDGDEKSKNSADEAEPNESAEKADETEDAEKSEKIEKTEKTEESSESAAEPKEKAAVDEIADDSKDADVTSNNGDKMETDEKEADDKEASDKETSDKEANEKEASEKEASEKDAASEKEGSEKDAASDKDGSEKDGSEKDGSEKDGSEKDGSNKDDSDKEKPAELQHSLLPDYVLIGNVPKEELVRGYERPKTRNECEVILLIGLPGAGKTHWANQHSKDNVDKHYNILGVQNLLNKMTVNRATYNSQLHVYSKND